MKKDIPIPDETNPLLVAVLLILTGGLYFILWVYHKNKELLEISKYELEPLRGLSVLGILPFCIGIFLWLLHFIAPDFIITILLYLLGTFAMFTILKYLFELSYYMSKATESSLGVWFLPFCITLTGCVLLSFENFLGYVLIITPLIHLPILQSYINIYYRGLWYKREKHNSLYNR